jgi:hypothetical protein
LDFVFVYCSELGPLFADSIVLVHSNNFSSAIFDGRSVYYAHMGGSSEGAAAPAIGLSFVLRSTDSGSRWSDPISLDRGGQTKQPGMMAKGGPLAALEISMAESNVSGAVMALVRPFASPWMWESWSFTGGKTWGPLSRGPFPLYAAMSAMITTASGVMLIGGRYPALSVQVSFTSGMSWKLFTVDYSGVWANGAMIEVAPDRILFVYGGSDPAVGALRAMNLRVSMDEQLLMNDEGILPPAPAPPPLPPPPLPPPPTPTPPSPPTPSPPSPPPPLPNPLHCSKPPCLQVTHIIFAIHDLLYQNLPPAKLKTGDYELFLEVEREVETRQLVAIRAATSTTLFVQHEGPKTSLQKPCKSALGARRCIYNMAAGPYADMATSLLAHTSNNSIVFDPATVTSELWGESYEGCVPGYGGAYAQFLGLQVQPNMRFDMCVFDSRFLYKSSIMIKIPNLANGSDIEAAVFQLWDNSTAASFQCRLCAMWQDRRKLVLDVDPNKVSLVTKAGFTLFPKTPGDPHGTYPQTNETVSLMMSHCVGDNTGCWLRGRAMTWQEMATVVHGLRVLATPQPLKTDDITMQDPLIRWEITTDDATNDNDPFSNETDASHIQIMTWYLSAEDYGHNASSKGHQLIESVANWSNIQVCCECTLCHSWLLPVA